MPEAPENEGMVAYGENVVKQIEAKEKVDWTMQGLVFDASRQDKGNTALSGRLKAGFVDRLQPAYGIKRGSAHHQMSLWPHFLRSYEELQTLEFKEFKGTNRTVEVHFTNGAVLEMAPLTHTVLQIYSIADWEKTVYNVRNTHRFKTAVAIIFKRYVFSFNSNDQLFQVRVHIYNNSLENLYDVYFSQPKWYRNADDIVRPPDIVDDPYEGVLEEAVKFIESHWKHKGAVFAAEAMKKDGQMVWHGMGNYSSSECFTRAGVSIMSTEQEVFRVPSRVARLIEAHREHCLLVRERLWSKLISPCVRGTMLAPSQEQRKKYASWLQVWGKQRIFLARREATLVDEFNAVLVERGHQKEGPRGRMKCETLLDPFEPSRIKHALSRPDNLGYLIFGREWRTLSPVTPTQSYDKFVEGNALARLFKRKGVLGTRTYLKAGHYDDGVLLSGEEMKRAWRNVQAYKTKWTFWSVVDAFPSDLLAHTEAEKKGQKRKAHEITKLSSSQTESHLFLSKIARNGVAIGPLEYSGHPRVVKTLGGGIIVSICREDPTLSSYYASRIEKGIKRRAKVVKGKRKVSHNLGYKKVCGRVDGPSGDLDNERPRKRRRSADMLVMAGTAYVY